MAEDAPNNAKQCHYSNRETRSDTVCQLTLLTFDSFEETFLLFLCVEWRSAWRNFCFYKKTQNKIQIQDFIVSLEKLSLKQTDSSLCVINPKFDLSN